MGKFDEVLESAGNFIRDNKGLVIGGLGGTALGAGAAYGLTNGNDTDSPSLKLKKRLRAAGYGALLGGLSGLGAGYVFDNGNIGEHLQELYNKVSEGPGMNFTSPAVEVAGDAAAVGVGGWGTYNSLGRLVQNAVNKKLIEDLDALEFSARYAHNEKLADSLKLKLERLKRTGFLGKNIVTKGRGARRATGLAGALLALAALESYVW